MRIILLANNIVGLEITQFLKAQGEDIVGLGIHEIEKQKNTEEIIKVAGVKKERIFRAHSFQEKETLTIIKQLKPDIIIAAFWGYILRKELLAIPPLGVVNFHPGYLPYNRGMNPNVWSFIENTPPGVTIHYVDEGIDTGDIIARELVPLALNDTAETIYRKTLSVIVMLFKKSWPKIKEGTASRINQTTLENPTFHFAGDIVSLDKIELDKSYTGREILNRLKARTYKNRFYSFFEENGKRVYVRLQLSKIYVSEKVEFKEFKEFITQKLTVFKSSSKGLRVLIVDAKKNKIGSLVLLVKNDSGDTSLIRMFAKWRKKNAAFFPTQFPVTLAGTKSWFENQVIEKEDRVLFLVKNNAGEAIGHMGLYTFNYSDKSCEIDNVVRGEKTDPGIMSYSIQALLQWTRRRLRIEKIFLRVFADNFHAISFYERNGFKVFEKIPLTKKTHGKIIRWVETTNKQVKPERYFLRMIYTL